MADFIVADPVNHLDVNNHLFKRDQIGDIGSNADAFLKNVVTVLLAERNPASFKLNNYCVFIRFFNEPMDQLVEDFHSTADDFLSLFLRK